MFAPDWPRLQPVAHRGLHDAEHGIIENTETAVQAAIDAGYGIEVDLQLSADHRAMVFHDATLERLTLASGRLIEKTYNQLQNVDIAKTSDEMISLNELLNLVKGQVPLFLEIKSQWGNVGPLEQTTAKALSAYKGPVAIMSFDPESIAEFKKIAPEIIRGIVAGGFHDDYARKYHAPMQRFLMRHLLHVRKTKPHFIAYNVKYLHYPAPQIAHHLFNYPLLAWTVRNEDDLRRAKHYGATPIFEKLRP